MNDLAEFLESHWSVMAATDIFATEVWTTQGLIPDHVLFLIVIKEFFGATHGRQRKLFL
jgi:hypothetical protein